MAALLGLKSCGMLNMTAICIEIPRSTAEDYEPRKTIDEGVAGLCSLTTGREDHPMQIFSNVAC